MIVEYDRFSGVVNLLLPQHLKQYEPEVLNELQNTFAFETITPDVIAQMNQFVINWFHQHGIVLDQSVLEEPDENKNGI